MWAEGRTVGKNSPVVLEFYGAKQTTLPMNFNAVPFARLLAPLVLGILFGEISGLENPVSAILLIAATCFLGFFAFQKFRVATQNWFGSLAIVALFLLGWQLVFFENEKNAADHFSKIKLENEAQFFVAKLDEPLSRTAKKLRARCQIQAIGTAPDSLKNCSGNLLIYIDTTHAGAGFEYGDLLILKGKFQRVPPPRNPSGFNYQQYLHFQNIHYQSFISKNDLQRLPENRANPIWKMAYDSRDRFLKILKKHFPTTDEYAVASALLIGYKTDLSDEIKNAYVETGSMHALAVSGMHVGGLYLPLAYFFRRFHRKNRARRVLEPLISLLVIWGFTFVTGASSSVMRAAAMFTIIIIGRALRRDVNIYNVLAASAFILLLWNPYFLFDAGFQLSYAAVVGIVFLGKKFLQKWHPPRGLGWAWETVAVGFAAQIATLPISLYYFHQMPLYFWLSGLVVVPLGMGILWAGMVLFLIDGLVPVVAFWLGKAMFWVIFFMNKGIFFIQKLPGSLIEGISFGLFAAVLLYFLTASLAGFWLERRSKWLVASLGCFAFLAGDHAIGRFFEQKTRKITVFSIAGKSLVDFQAGEKLVSITDSISEKDLGFAVDKSKRVGAANVFFEKDTSFQTENLFYAPPFAQFFDKKIVVIGPDFSLPKIENIEPIAVDFVVFRQNPTVKIEEILEQFPCRAFIFDGSNSFYKIKKWSADCAERGIEFHDLRKEGAFVFDL